MKGLVQQQIETQAFKEAMYTAVRQAAPHLTLLTLLLAYSVFGAFLFTAIEHPVEIKERAQKAVEQTNRLKDHVTLAQLQEGLSDKLWFEDNHVIDRQAYREYVTRLLGYYTEDVKLLIADDNDADDDDQGDDDSEDWNWDFVGSLFYAGTIYTTVGYGHIAPSTNAGKLATMMYGAIGIPLCLIVLADLGNICSGFIKRLLKAFRRLLPNHITSQPEWPTDDHIDNMEGKYVALATTLLCAVYLLGGAYMYAYLEEWSLFDSFYFLFITTSTVGLGDYVPSNQYFFMLSFLYIFGALALVATLLTVYQEQIERCLSPHIQGVADTITQQIQDGNSTDNSNSNPDTTPHNIQEQSPQQATQNSPITDGGIQPQKVPVLQESASNTCTDQHLSRKEVITETPCSSETSSRFESMQRPRTPLQDRSPSRGAEVRESVKESEPSSVYGSVRRRSTASSPSVQTLSKDDDKEDKQHPSAVSPRAGSITTRDMYNSSSKAPPKTSSSVETEATVTLPPAARRKFLNRL